MSGNIVRLNWSAHSEADALLPWYVNGSLSEHERRAIDRHVRGCGRCRREIETLRQLQDAVRELGGSEPDTDVAFQRLIAGMDHRRGRGAGRRFGRLRDRIVAWWGRASSGKRWAVAAPCTALLAVAALLVAMPHRTVDGTYATLGAVPIPSVTAGTIVVVFDPRLPEAELRSIVRDAAARLVDGPTESHAYVLQVPAAREADVLAALRRRDGVLLAQPMIAGARQ